MSQNLNLYKKYRPQCLEDVVGQDTVKKLITQTLKQQKILQSFIFFGSSGTGKTSVARILAKAFNCELFHEKDDVCNECSNCKLIDSNAGVDIYEVDAATNNDVAHMRKLTQDSQYAPLRLKKKVYIIDEAHNLRSPSWDALLKVIEEPYENIIFLFLTTNIQKIPETIISRCQKYAFAPLSKENLKEIIDRVSQKENRSISLEAKDKLAGLSLNSARECLSLLEQVFLNSQGDIHISDLDSLFSLPQKKELLDLTRSVLSGDFDGSFKHLERFISENKNLLNLFAEMLSLFMDVYVYQKTKNPDLLKKFTKEEISEFEKNEYLLEYMNVINDSIHKYVLSGDKMVWSKLVLFGFWEIGGSKKKPINIAKSPEVSTVVETYEIPEHLKNKLFFGINQANIREQKSLENCKIYKSLLSSDSKNVNPEIFNALNGKIIATNKLLTTDRTVVLIFREDIDAKVFQNLVFKPEIKEELDKYFMHKYDWIAVPKSKWNECIAESKSKSAEELSEEVVFGENVRKKVFTQLSELLETE